MMGMIENISMRVIPENLMETDTEVFVQYEKNQDKMISLMQNLSKSLHDRLSQREKWMENVTSTLEFLSHVIAHLIENKGPMMEDEQEESSSPPSDCQDIAQLPSGPYESGIYTIHPQDGMGSIEVYCDLDINDKGWIVFQRRFDGSVDFYRGWKRYEKGFGKLDGEFWMGLTNMHRFTKNGNWSLVVDLEDFDGNTAHAEYDYFNIGNATTKYRLSVGEYSSGTAGDSLRVNDNMGFSTKDRDNLYKCAKQRQGAWWYFGCTYSNLNGLYLGPSGNISTGMFWWDWRQMESLKSSVMKMHKIN